MRPTLILAWLIGLSLLTTNSSHAQDDDLLDMLPAMLAGIKRLPRPIDFKVAQPIIPAGDEYLIELGRWDIPSNRTQPVKTTDNLQAAIDWARNEGYSRVRLPDGRYLIGKYGNAIYQAGIVLHDDTQFTLSNNAVLEMDTNDKWNYCVISVDGKSDVIIRGGTIKGDKATHIFTPRQPGGSTAHDEGHGVCIKRSTRVLVENMRINNLTGDGLLLVTEVSDVTIRNNNISYNRRQGVSVVGGIRIKIENNEIHHIRGTSPQFGIDIEGAGRIDQDILIRKNYFHHNRGGDIVNTSGKNTFIIDNVLHQGREGSDFRYIDGPLVTWERTDNVIAHNTITMLNGSVNGRLGYIQYSGNRDNNPQITYVHDNVCNGCGMYWYNAADVDIRRNVFKGYFLALSNVKRAAVIDNDVYYGPPGTPRYCWSYRLHGSTGVASGNTLEGEPFNVPLSSTPYYQRCVVQGF
jgi:parallel beta-helix repeat protein